MARIYSSLISLRTANGASLGSLDSSSGVIALFFGVVSRKSSVRLSINGGQFTQAGTLSRKIRDKKCND